MADTSLLQLLRRADTAQPTLLVLDENTAQLPRNPFAQVQVICNRCDAQTMAQAQGWPSRFCDFEFDPAALPGCSQALYRISKEKRVVEHVLQSLWALLPVGGTLLCAGYKNEGIKTFAKRMQAAWQCEVSLERGDLQLHCYHIVKTGSAAEPLNSEDYHALLPIGSLNGQLLLSKPGIFAWDRFDVGSSFLLEHLREFLQGSALATVDAPDTANALNNESALDLGCGYGLLAVTLLQAGFGRVVATDNNAAAVRACADNLQRLHGSSEVAVIAADCADGIDERFDLILCNPPFHQGFDVAQDLTDRFLAATRRLLKPRGRALFVVNSFIPLERKAAGLFAQVQLLSDNHRFKLVALAAPARR